MEHDWGPWQGSKASSGGQYRMCELCGISSNNGTQDCPVDRLVCGTCRYMLNGQCRLNPPQLYVVHLAGHDVDEVNQDYPAVGPEHPACGKYEVWKITPIEQISRDIPLGDILQSFRVLDPEDPDIEEVSHLVALGIMRGENDNICLSLPADRAGAKPLQITLTGTHGVLGPAEVLVSRWLKMMDESL